MKSISLALLVLPLAACASRAERVTEVVAEIVDEEKRVVGRAVFTSHGDGVRIALRLSGLPPGPHGVHIHEGGECAPPGFDSAGGHFNPFGKEHGLSNPNGPHAGDLPNIHIAQDGTYQGTLQAPLVTLGSGPNSLLKAGGTSIVIHAQPDDGKTNPSGNTGARIACGSIGHTGPAESSSR